MDELYNAKIDKQKLCTKYNLKPDEPIILFAPSWGGKYSKNSGINNISFFKNIKNLLVVPHPADYGVAKKTAAIIPEKNENINQFIKLADIVISEVSSVAAEACLLDKQVIQLILNKFPGCFPEKDKRKDESWIKNEILKNENSIDRSQRPFKIPYIDEDWILGHSCTPENVEETIKTALKEKEKYSKNRKHWAEQSCWGFDGKICERMIMMIISYLETGAPKQIECLGLKQDNS